MWMLDVGRAQPFAPPTALPCPACWCLVRCLIAPNHFHRPLPCRRELSEEDLLLCCYSIGDNNSYLAFNRDPVDR